MTRYKKQKQSYFTVLTDGKGQGKARRKDGKNKKPGTPSPQGQKNPQTQRKRAPPKKDSNFCTHFSLKAFAYLNFLPYLCTVILRDVAQPGRVHVWGACCRRFKSCHPDY